MAEITDATRTANIQGDGRPATWALTLSGNEVTDATRAAAASLGTDASGQMLDGRQPEGSFGIYRAATNLFRNGQVSDLGGYVSTGGGVSLAGDTTVPPPFSTQSIRVTTDGTVNQGVQIRTTGDPLGNSAGTNCVGSYWFKGVSGQSYRQQIILEYTDGTSTSGTVTTFTATGGWQQIVPVPVVVAAGKTLKHIYLRAQVNGTRAESFWVAHGMIETGQSVVAPYVATSGGNTATHAAARVQAPAFLLDETQGWVAMRTRIGWSTSTAPASFPGFFDIRDDGTHRMVGFYDKSGSRFCFTRDNGSVGASVNTALTVAAGDLVTYIAVWTATQIKVSVNGGSFATLADTDIPTLAATTFDIGSSGGGGVFCDSDVLWFACGKGTLTDDDAAALYASGNAAPALSSLPGQPTMLWDCVDENVQPNRESSFGIWEGTTNLFKNGGVETDTSQFGSNRASLSRDTTRAKFGTASLKTTLISGGAAQGPYLRDTATSTTRIAVSPSTTYTASAWVFTPDSGHSTRVQFEWYDATNVQLGTLAGPVLDLIANKWVRLTWTATSPEEAAFCTVGFYTPTEQTGERWFDGFQFEQKAIPTPYVHTNGAIASRSAARVQAPASLLDETQGWVAMRVKLSFANTLDPTSDPGFWSWGDNINNGIRLAHSDSSFTSPSWFMRRVNGGSFREISVASDFSAEDTVMLLAAWTATQLALSVDGSAFRTTTPSAANIPTLSATMFDIGQDGLFTGRYCDSSVLWFACGKGTLTDDDAATINNFGRIDPMPEQFPASAVVTGVWHADDGQILYGHQENLVVSGNEITDATRALQVEGDGRYPPFKVNASGNEISDATRSVAGTLDTASSGQMLDTKSIPKKVTNLLANGGFETDTTGWAGRFGTETLTRVTTQKQFGSASLQVDTPGGIAAEAAIVHATLISGVTYTFSAYVSYPAGETFGLAIGQAGFKKIENKTGTGSFQRYSITYTAAATSDHEFHIRVGSGSEIVATTFYIDGAQVETGSTANPYVETDGAIATEITAPAADSSFGIHRGATNLFRRGQCDAITDWGPAASGTHTRTTDSTTPPPFSTQSIKYVLDGTTTGQGVQALSATGQNAAPGTLAVGSIYFKGVSGLTYSTNLGWLNTDASFTIGANTPFVATGQWQLLTPTPVVVPEGKTGDRAHITVSVSGAARAETVWAAHAMLEKGQSVVAPYVATSGGNTAAHSASRVQAPASLIDEAQGWIAVRARSGWASNNAPNDTPSFFGWQDDTNNRLLGFYRSSNNTLEMQRKAGVGIQSSAIVTAPSIAPDDELTAIFAWDATHTYVSVNGGAFVSAGGGGIPTLASTTFDIGTNGLSTTFHLAGAVLWFACGRGTLTDADAATIHAFGNSDPTKAAMPGGCTAVWSAATTTYDTDLDSSVGIWQGTTNLVKYGGFETWSSGAPTGYTVGSSATVTQVSGKFGSYACRFTSSGAGNENASALNFGGTLLSALDANTTYTASFWARRVTGTHALNLAIDPVGSFVVTTSDTSGDWVRVSGTFTTGATGAASGRFHLGSANDVWDIDGFQIEKTSIPTPYVHTNGTTASRSAARVQGYVGKLFTPTQGWVAMRVRMGLASTADPHGGGFPRLFGWRDDANNEYAVEYDVANDRFRIIRRNAGANDNATTATQVFATGDYRTVVVAWTSTQVKISIEGGAFTSAAGADIPALAATTFDIGSLSNTSNWFDGDILWFACGNGILTDGDAATIHSSFWNKEPFPTDLPGSCTGTWHASTNVFHQV